MWVRWGIPPNPRKVEDGDFFYVAALCAPRWVKINWSPSEDWGRKVLGKGRNAESWALVIRCGYRSAEIDYRLPSPEEFALVKALLSIDQSQEVRKSLEVWWGMRAI